MSRVDHYPITRTNIGFQTKLSGDFKLQNVSTLNYLTTDVFTANLFIDIYCVLYSFSGRSE